MNKFLKKYPQLREPIIGDKIKIIQCLDINHNIIDTTKDHWGYHKDDIGIIYAIRQDYFEMSEIFVYKVEIININRLNRYDLYRKEFIVIDYV